MHVAIMRKHLSCIDVNEEDVPDLVTLMGKLAASSITNNYQLRALINATFIADGRPGEGKFFNMRSWNYSNGHKCLTGSWKDIKNCTEKLATFCNDFDQWETDVYDSFGDYWSVENGLVRKLVGGRMGLKSNFAFSMCQDRTDGWTARIIASTLSNLVPACQKKKVTGKSLRYGATTSMHEHPDITHTELLAVGGWWSKDNSSHYTVGRVAIHMRPMRALAGYCNVRKAHVPPWLGALGEVELPLMETLADKLYLTNLNQFKVGGHLRPLIRIVLATNIKNFNKKLATLGIDNASVSRLISVAGSCGIPLERLKEMSSTIDDDFRLQNIQGIELGAGIERLLEHNNTLMTQMVSKISDLNATIKTQNQRIGCLETLQQQSKISSSMIPLASPQAINRVRLLQDAAESPRPQQRPKLAQPAQVQQQQQRIPLRDYAVGILQRVTGIRRDAIPVNEEVTAIASSSYDASPSISRVIIELVKAHQLGPNVQYIDTTPPPSLFPAISSGNRNVYKWAMKVIKKVITKEQDKLFRSASNAKDPDLTAVVSSCAELERNIILWVLEKEGVKENSRNNKALVYGIGNRAKKLGESHFSDLKGFGDLRNIFGGKK
jgi:hypothetical protein